MRALRVHALAGPQALRLEDVVEPTPGENDILIDVCCAGVSFADTLMTEGRYQVKPPLPFSPGIDVAGTVRVAPAGSRWPVGMPVIAYTGWGGLAEVAAARSHFVCPLPAGFDWAQGVALMLNYQTAYFGLVWRGRLAHGETVVVHGASGGVGTAAVQIACALGANVIGVVGRPSSGDVVTQAGASEIIVHSARWVTDVAELTGGRGADIVVDPVGGQRSGESLRALAPRGRLLVVGFAAGEIPTIQLHRVLNRNVDVVGVAWPPFGEIDRTMPAQIGKELDELVRRGAVRPVIGRRFPLERGVEALLELSTRRATGKVVVDMPDARSPTNFPHSG